MEIETRKLYYDEDKTNLYQLVYHIKYLPEHYHREDGPAFQSFYESGKLKRESYWINNVRHREDGPAIINYYEYGDIASQNFYIYGKQLTEQQFKMKQRLKGTLLEDKY